MKHLLTIVLSVLLLSLPEAAGAADQTAARPGATAEAPADAAQLRADHEKLRVQLDRKKGPFKDLDADQSRALQQHIDTVLAHLEGVQRMADLPEAQRTALFATLAAIQALVAAAEDQRMVCEPVAALGSRIRTVSCKSAAMRREEARAAEQMLSEDRQQAPN
jgi:hypothetical protein